MDDNVSWPPRSNDRFIIWKPLLNHIWVTETLNRPQKHPNMVLFGMFSEPYIQYPVQAQAYVRSCLFPCSRHHSVLLIKIHSPYYTMKFTLFTMLQLAIHHSCGHHTQMNYESNYGSCGPWKEQYRFGWLKFINIKRGWGMFLFPATMWYTCHRPFCFILFIWQVEGCYLAQNIVI